MKFDEKFKNSKPGEQFPFEGSEVAKGEKLRQCWHCQEDTTWVDISFIAHLCSEECSRAKWKEYQEACEI